MSDVFELPDLVSERVGGAVLAANDEFFAPKENLIKASEPVWREGEYTDRGKWMDGWETRRRRAPGHDWAILRLGLPGVIHGVVVDTSHFRGNYPDACSIEVCEIPDTAERAMLAGDDVPWREIRPMSKLEPNAKNRFVVKDAGRATHLRFNIYPDGGVARLRVHGLVTPDWDEIDFRGGWVDLAAMEHGGCVIGCSDEFFGSRHHLILPGPARGMSEGWETRRRRGEGHDWVIVQLGAHGVIERVDLDTSHFIGNAPYWCSLEVCVTDEDLSEPGHTEPGWRTLLPKVRVEPNKRHVFASELRAAGAATHARLNIYPDGGVARLRLHGYTTRSRHIRAAIARLNALRTEELEDNLLSCCGSRAWARAMAASRPFGDVSDLVRSADEAWARIGEEDWREAFAAHPRIGEVRLGSERSASWSRGEQSGVKGADPALLDELAAENGAYFERYGFTFIVCATGKTANAMLENLRERLGNDTRDEISIAGEEQRKITRLRLGKLIRSMIETANLET